jgi:uncharacterized membrane protein
MATVDALERPRRRSHSDGSYGGSFRPGSRESQNRNDMQDAERLATGLGWFSIALGLIEIATPGPFARVIGAEDDDTTCRTLRVAGVRELIAGIGILSQPGRPAGWVWSRVAGDAMDLAMLGKAMTSDGNDRGRLALATAAVLGVTALDYVCAEKLSEQAASPTRWAPRRWLDRLANDRAIRVNRAITINRSAEDLYRFWRDLTNLPQIMHYLEAVTPLDGRRSHWKAKGPLGVSIEWDAEITEDQPDLRLAWRSLPNASVQNSGSVRFEAAPGKRGTVVYVELHYNPPGGPVGAAFAKLFGRAPEQEVAHALREFKQMMELGEIVQSDSTVKGWGSARASGRPSQLAHANRRLR